MRYGEERVNGDQSEKKNIGKVNIWPNSLHGILNDMMRMIIFIMMMNIYVPICVEYGTLQVLLWQRG